MNSYFASVEQQANPLLRGKPLGVCAYLSPNGCIIASSKEAKKIGIKTGCLVKDAKRIYPKINLVENEPAKYRSTTEKIFKIYSEYTDRIEPYSIDEAFLDMTGYIKSYEEGEVLIQEIKERIKNEVGEWLTCSAGLSWTRWLAKFAGDIAESDGCNIIRDENQLNEVLKSVKMTDAWGIGDKIALRLNALGLFNLKELKDYPTANIMRAMGKYGYYLWANVNGIEIEKVRNQEELLPKSIGHSYCVPVQTNDMDYISSVLLKLCEKTGRRLRDGRLEAFSIYAGYTLVDGGKFFKSKKQHVPLYSTKDIYREALSIINSVSIDGKVRMLAVSVGKLTKYSGQMSILQDVKKDRNLSDALDKINNRYGEFLVHYGNMLGIKEQANDRIGFRKTVKIKVDNNNDI